MFTSHRKQDRSGNVLVLTAIMMVVMFALVAMAVDIGYLQVVGSELQRCADAAALSAASELLDENAAVPGGDPEVAIEAARTAAGQYTRLNVVGGDAPILAQNDTEIGCIRNPLQTDQPMDLTDPSRFNAVRIHVRRTADVNGEVPLFFARVLGYDSQAMQADATAMYLNNFGGFRAPTGEGENLKLLPFALDWDTWDGLMKGQGTDNWAWNAETGTVTQGQDKVLEVNLFPQGTGSPGNRGTVDIGPSNNSTSDIARQIVEGISAQDLVDLGKPLEFDANGELELNGDTGISAGVKDELASIIGEPRCIPVFKSVVGPGNNAQYTITCFVGIRIMEVKLTGSMNSKRVIIQPARFTCRGGVPATTAEPKSYYVFSPVWLVR